MLITQFWETLKKQKREDVGLKEFNLEEGKAHHLLSKVAVQLNAVNAR